MRTIILLMSRWLVRLLLRLLPLEARAVYGAALLDTFARLQHDAHGVRALLAVSWREVAALLWVVLRERWRLVVLMLRELGTRGWASDLRQAGRALRRAPLYTLSTAITIGLGVAGVAVVYSLVRVTLLSPLPYGSPDALVRLYETPHGAYSGATTSIPNVLAWQERSRTLEHIVLVSAGGFATVRLEPNVVRVRAARVSRGFFELLGRRPLLGALPAAADFDAGGVRWAVVTHAFWRAQLGGDSAVAGRSLRVDGADAQVVAVMPAGFTFPDGGTEIFLPLRVTPGVGLASPNGRWARLFNAYARIKPGVTIEQAGAELRSISLALQQEFGPPNDGMTAYPRPLKDSMLGNTRVLLLILLASAGLVLLIACGNVAALALVRSAAREKDIAIRIMHGANRGAIARHLASEVLLVCLMGGGLAVYLGMLLFPVAARLIPDTMPHAELNVLHAIPVVLAISSLTALVLFLAVLRPDGTLPPLVRALAGSSSRTTGSRRQLRMRTILVAGQISFALTLLVLGGALLRSYLGLARQPVGFDAHNLTLVSASTPGARYADPARVVQFYDQLLERVRALPGVGNVALTDVVPLTTGGTSWTFVPEGGNVEAGREPAADVYTIDDNFNATLKIPLRAGRTLQAIDTFPLSEGVLVSESLARQQFGSAAQALGRRISLGAVSSGNPLMTIVGVTGDIRDASLATPPQPLIFRRHAAQTTIRTMTLIIASHADPLVLGSQVSQIVREVDADVPTFGVRSLESVVADAATRERFTASMAVCFALLALLLACLGVSGLQGEIALQQQRAQAIRLALGAARRDVLLSATRKSLAVTMSGATLGAALAWLASNAIKPFVFGVPALDLPALLGGVGLFVLIGVTAAVVPTWRVARGGLAALIRTE